MTPATLTIAKKFFKLTAIIKYLFFPFLTANAAGVNFNQLIGTNATIVAKDVTEKAIWIGTNEGLYKICKKDLTVQHFTTENSVLPSNNVTGICTNSDDNVFVSTDKGLLRYDGYSYMTITTENAKLPTDNITSIACDGAGYLWLGTNKGLVMMRGYKTKVFNTQNSPLTTDKVVSMIANGMISIDATLADNTKIEITNQGMTVIPNNQLEGAVAKQ